MPFRGLSMLFHKGLRGYVMIPLLINIIIFSLIAWLAVTYFEAFLIWALPTDSWLQKLEWILWPLFALTYAVLTFYSFTMVANLIASPFNGILAGKIEEIITGKLPQETDTSVLAAIIPAVTGELGKIWYFLLRAIPVLILMLIPGLAAIGSILWLLLGFWFLTIEYVDYPMGNHGFRPGQQRTQLRAQPIKSWSFGAGATQLLMNQVLNFSAMPATLAGATLFWLNKL
jgi:CysZ protein